MAAADFRYNTYLNLTAIRIETQLNDENHLRHHHQVPVKLKGV
jgi:hypothetical protein